MGFDPCSPTNSEKIEFTPFCFIFFRGGPNNLFFLNGFPAFQPRTKWASPPPRGFDPWGFDPTPGHGPCTEDVVKKAFPTSARYKFRSPEELRRGGSRGLGSGSGSTARRDLKACPKIWGTRSLYIYINKTIRYYY